MLFVVGDVVMTAGEDCEDSVTVFVQRCVDAETLPITVKCCGDSVVVFRSGEGDAL